MELPLMFRLKGTVILTIWWQVLGFIGYTYALLYLHNYVDGWTITFPMTLVPVLGVVTGLLLVFRTNTAYDRYWEGRKIWSTMTWNIRTLTRCIWVGVEEKGNSSKVLIEKTSAVNLLVAFAFATRNYLREEYSYEEDGLRDLISHIPRISTPSSTQTFQNQVEGKTNKTWSDMEKKVKGAKVDSSAAAKEAHAKKERTYNLKAYETPVPSNIPLELSFYIASYINSVRLQELVDGATVTLMNNALNSLVECLGSFERILRTPIPLAYSVHLHHATWLYLLALPYQLIGALNWFAIPVVALAAFALLGILGIGWEIENPFGYDDNDLPLDDFCKVIHKEIIRIIGHRMPTPESWLLSQENHPLAPVCYLTAADLAKMPEDDVREILEKRSHIQLSSSNSKGCPQIVITSAKKSSTGAPPKDGSGPLKFNEEEMLFIDEERA